MGRPVNLCTVFRLLLASSRAEALALKYLRAIDAKRSPEMAAVRAAVAAEWRQARAVNPAVARLLWRRTRAYEKAWEAIMEEIWSDSTAGHRWL